MPETGPFRQQNCDFPLDLTSLNMALLGIWQNFKISAVMFGIYASRQHFFEVERFLYWGAPGLFIGPTAESLNVFVVH